MSRIEDQLAAHVRNGEYEKAYRLGQEVMSNQPENLAVLSILYELTAKLRSECMDLGIQKADSGAHYMSKENLLQDINKLTGEDMYGRINCWVAYFRHYPHVWTDIQVSPVNNAINIAIRLQLWILSNNK